jgi:hypothetical protein
MGPSGRVFDFLRCFVSADSGDASSRKRGMACITLGLGGVYYDDSCLFLPFQARPRASGSTYDCSVSMNSSQLTFCFLPAGTSFLFPFQAVILYSAILQIFQFPRQI